VAVVLGLLLFIWPLRLLEVWPWPLTPLTARVVAGICVLGGAGIGMARNPRWASARLLLHVLWVMVALILVATVRAWDEFDRSLATWAFEKAGEAVEIAPEGRLTLSSAYQELQAAIAGQGIAHVFDDYARAAIDEGTLVELLADWSPKLPSWYLYYPNKRHNSAAMRAFLEFVRRSAR
jgi:hypothetical protein